MSNTSIKAIEEYLCLSAQRRDYCQRGGTSENGFCGK